MSTPSRPTRGATLYELANKHTDAMVEVARLRSNVDAIAKRLRDAQEEMTIATVALREAEERRDGLAARVIQAVDDLVRLERKSDGAGR